MVSAQSGCIRFTLLLGLLIVVAQSQAIIPEDAKSAYVTSLNGTWKFKLFPNDDALRNVNYQEPAFDDSHWQDITVPGNWETQGFEEPQYGTPDESVIGIYRTTFSIPDSWKSRHVLLYTEGVAFGYELWINGKRAGSFESAFQRAEFDITESVRFDTTNSVVLEVYRNRFWVGFDCTDDWALSGIFRDIYLSAAPYAHIEDLSIVTKTGNGKSPAMIHGKIVVNLFFENDLKLKNLSADISLSHKGKLISTQLLKFVWSNTKYLPDPLEFRIPVQDASLWNAETPSLYDLSIILKDEDQPLHTLNQRCGIREVMIDGAILKLNGKPIKLRGVCRLEIHPEVGRALREKHWLEDIRLMKEANINAIRMTHWPRHPGFLDLCDELGMYVIDEVPFDFGDDKLVNPLALGALLARAQNTVDRDKNHPSVIIWSVGNENPSTPKPRLLRNCWIQPAPFCMRTTAG